MKILYNQLHADPLSAEILKVLGVHSCYFKHLLPQRDNGVISPKSHYHTQYELHIIENGSVTYGADNTVYSLKSGHFLLFPPRNPHHMTYRSADASSISITFHLNRQETGLPEITQTVCGLLPDPIQQNLQAILCANSRPEHLSGPLFASHIQQILLQLWTFPETADQAPVTEDTAEDPRLTIARQYICDNIDRSPSVPEVASYCHLSTRQLTRLFHQSENCTPAAFINRVRTSRMEALLKNRSLSLHTISESLNFSSEYYFHTFFKKHAGMTPGEFRNMYT